MEALTGTTSLMVAPPMGAPIPTGVFGWADVGAVLVWLVLMAFVGTLLGMLRDRVSPKLYVARPRHLDHALAHPA